MAMILVLGALEAAGAGMLTVQAQDLKYEGIVQFDASDVYSVLDTSRVELIVEEVYLSSGGYLQEGADVLKLTDDSYQDALDYYSAAIIRAGNNLTNTQLEYEQAMQDARYTYEIAAAEAGQAVFVRDEQTRELEDTIEAHAEIMSELEEAIAEYEEGIENGSYSSASGGTSSGGSASGNKSGSTSKNQKESEQMTELESETESELESETCTDVNPDESEGQSDTYPDQSESDIHPDESEEQTDNSELDEKIRLAEEKVLALESEVERQKQNVQIGDSAYNEILKALYKSAGINVEVFCGTGIAETEAGAQLVSDTAVKTASADTEESELPQETLVVEEKAKIASAVETASENAEKAAETQAPTEPQTQTSTEPQTQTSTEPQTQTSTEPQTQAPAEPQSQESTEGQSQESTEGQSQESIEGQSQELTEGQSQESTEGQSQESTEEQSQESTEEQSQESTEEQSQELTENQNQETAGNQTQEPTEGQTQESETDKPETEEKTVEELLTELAGMEAERYRNYQQLREAENHLKAAQNELNILNQEKENIQKPGDESELLGDESEMPGDESEVPEGMPGNESEVTGDMQDQSEMPDGIQNGSFPGMSGDASGNSTAGMSGDASGNSTAGMSGSMPYGISGFSGSAAASMSGGTVSTGGTMAMSGGSMQMNFGTQMQEDDSDISLFGDKYDLTEVKNLLDQEPASEDAAEELLENLKEWSETVALQYEELCREEAATRLDIQYTYDCAVIEGKQAEITYQEECENQETTLQEAKDALAELEEEKALLEGFENGVLTAETGGYVAAAGYEAEDRLNASTALYSIYDMQAAAVSIEVPQEEIALFSVGNTVNVELNGRNNQEGIISAKAPDSTGEGSRTSVNYEVEISIDNSNGRLSSQTAAVITIGGENEEESKDE